MSTQEPVWQVNVDGQIYEAELEVLKRWVAEGRVLATDSVRKGALNWIAANRAPALRGLFSEAGSSQPGPIQPPQAETLLPSVSHSESVADHDSFAPETKSGAAPDLFGASACHNHADRSATYSC